MLPFPDHRSQANVAQPMQSSSLGRAARWVLLFGLVFAYLAFAFLTRHWMMVGDSPIMHYVLFLMDHGLKPYSEITDNNLPGSYMTEWLGMHIFGPGDLGWRLYEDFLLLALTAAMALIARPYDWAAGVFGAGVFLLIHGKEGIWLAAEREQVMTLLLMLGYAALFTSVRRRRPAWMLAAGFLLAFAASIKPTVAPLALVLLVFASVVLRRRGIRWLPYTALGLAGIALAATANLVFLAAHGAWKDFLCTERVITPYYVALQHLPFREMLARLVPAFVLGILAAAASLIAGRFHRNPESPVRRWTLGWTWEQWAVALGALAGLVSYFQQGKGYLHHRYLFLSFLLLLAGLELMRALRQRGWRLLVASAATIAVALFYIPWSIRAIARSRNQSDVTLGMMTDLQIFSSALPGGEVALQNRVQCLDLVYGCFNALYHQRLVENTGFMGDLIIFDPNDSPARREHRALWTRLARRNPADILLMSNEYFQGENTYNRVANWPVYQHYLAANYRLVVERNFPDETTPRSTDPRVEHGYRVYVRRGSPEDRIALPAQLPGE